MTGNAAILLGGPQNILQTIYVDDIDFLESVAIEETSGRVAVSGGRHVFVYKPLGRDEGALRWAQEHSLQTDTSKITSLSWASSEEILASGDLLCLWNISGIDGPAIIWEETLPSPIQLALFSHDAGLIASCGYHDRLVKIWRRLSFEVDNTRFDVSYLQHPRTVANFHWRKPWHAEQSLDNLLYTFCSDNRIRVWAYSDPHSRCVMQLVSEIDMLASIQPRVLRDQSNNTRRYGFVMDSRVFSSATEKTVQMSPSPNRDPAIEHLLEIAGRSPEIVVILDDLGHISAWGLENAGYRNKLPTKVFNVVHVQGLEMLLKPARASLEDRVRFCVFAGGVTDSSFTILVHYFHGQIDWYDTQIAHLFDSSPRIDRASLVSTWSGHDAPIEGIWRNSQGTLVSTFARNGTIILWNENASEHQPPLQRHCALFQSCIPEDLYHLDNNANLALLSKTNLALYEIGTSESKAIAKQNLPQRASQWCLMPFNPGELEAESILLVTVNADGSTLLWSLLIPREEHNSPDTRNGAPIPLQLLSELGPGAPAESNLLTVIPPTASISAPSSNIAFSLSNSILTACSTSMIRRQFAKFNYERGTLEWKSLNEFHTYVRNPTLMKACTSGMLALVDSERRNLSLWSYRDGFLDFEWQAPKEAPITHIEWAPTLSSRPLLAVGCPFHVYVFGPNLHRPSSPAESWVLLNQIRLRDFATYPLGGLIWLRSGEIVIGTGQQIFIHERQITPTSHTWKHLGMKKSSSRRVNMKYIVERLNAVAALFHPEFLIQLIVANGVSLLSRILLRLHQKMKFFSNGDILSSLLDYHPTKLYRLLSTNLKFEYPLPNDTFPLDEASENFLTAEVAQQLVSSLETAQLEQLDSVEIRNLTHLIKALESLEKHRGAVDVYGFRYLCLSTIVNEFHHNFRSIKIYWREVVFASHSNSQDILVESIGRSVQGRLTWEAASKSGLFLWLSDLDAVKIQMENVARSEYTKSEDRNPVNASLYYLALKKKSVLQGLWRVCMGNREKESTLKLLSQNFQESRWKNTALKNAYALLSKRRFEYAAAFFLLGGSLKDAINVCAQHLGQIDLAIAIARVYEGDEGPVLNNLLLDVVLPAAAKTGNRWMATWAFQRLHQWKKAVQVLVRPIHIVVEDGKSDIQGVSSGTKHAKHWCNNEPALIVEYVFLRDELVKKNQWQNVISLKEEWDFVLQCAREYVRMGCDYLALSLLRTWRFVAADIDTKSSKKSTNVAERASKTVDELEDLIPDARRQAEKKQGPPPTQFEEPSASSLLDSFGF